MADRMNIKFTIQAVDRFSATMNNLERKLDSIQRQADQLDLSRRVDIDVDTTQASAQLEALRAQIESMGGTAGGPEIDIQVDSGAAVAELAAIRALAEQMNTARIRAEVDADVARAELLRLRHLRDDLNDRPAIINVILNGYRKFRTNMDRIATTGRNVGEIVTNSFMGIATTFSTTLVPIIASTTGAIGALGVMAGVSAGASMGLVSSLMAMGGAAGGFAAVAIPAIDGFHTKMMAMTDLEMKLETARLEGDVEKIAELSNQLQEMQDGMTDSQERAQDQLGKLSDKYRALTDAMEPGVLNAYADSMKALGVIIDMATPMIIASVDAVRRLVDVFERNLKTDDVVAFFDYLNTQGAASLQVMTKALGNFLQGFFNLVVAFAPLSLDMQGGFLDMSEAFRKWTAALGENQKFQAFVDYVRTNWPKVRTIIGTAIAAIIETFAGFSGYAVDWMNVTQDLIDKWREFAQGMGENAKFQEFVDYIRTNGPKVNQMIADMVQFLVALGVALAPVGAKMVEVASAIFDFFTNILQANPVLGEMLGWFIALSGGFFTILPLIVMAYSFFSTFIAVLKLVAGPVGKLLGFLRQMFSGLQEFRIGLHIVRTALMGVMGPVALVIGVLTLLGAMFVHLWNTSEEFRSILVSAFENIKSRVSAAIDAVVGYVRSVWGGLVQWWAENGEMIKQAASNVWSVISTVIVTAMKVIAAIVKFVWPAVQFIIVSVWNNIKGVISGALTFIQGLIQTFAGLFTGNWSAMWEGIKTMFAGAVQFLWNAVQLLLWGRLLKGIFTFAAMFGRGVMSLWNSVKALFASGIAAVRTRFVTGWNAITNYVQTVWARMGQYIDDGISAMRTRVSNGLNAIRTFFSNIWTNIYVRVGDAMIAVRTAITNGMNAIKTFFSNAWTTIYVRVSDAMISIRTAISNAFNAVDNFVTGFLANLVSKFISGFNRVRTGVSNVLSSIDTFITGILGNIISRVVTFVSNLVTRFISGLNNVRTAVSNGMNVVRERFATVLTAVQSRVSSAMTTIQTRFTAMKDRVMAVINTLKDRGIAAFNAMKDRVMAVVNIIKDRSIQTFNTIRDRVMSAVNSLKERAITAWNTLKERAITAANTLRDRAVAAFNNLKERASTAVQNLLTAIRSKFDSILNAVKVKMEFVKSAVTTAWNNVMTFLRGIDLVQIGKDIINGLITGIKSMAGSLVKSAKGVVEGAIEGAKKLLGIKSPSRVFRAIGEYTMMGMQVGIDNEATRTVKAVSRVADAMTKAFNPQLEAAMNMTGSYNGYADASSKYAQTRTAQAQARAQESRTIVEVPVYLHGNEIARASNAEQNRMNAREEARRIAFSRRTGGVQ